MKIEYPKMKWSLLKKDYVTFLTKEEWDKCDKSNFIDTKQYLELIRNFPTNEDLVKFLTIENDAKKAVLNAPEKVVSIKKGAKRKKAKR